MNQIKCSTCLCENVCKYKDMGITEALKDFELNSQLQKFSSCLQIDVSCKNYVAKGGKVYENISK